MTNPDDTVAEQLDVLAWLGDRIACQRCRKALDTADKAAAAMVVSGQPINPSPRIGRQFWGGYLTVLACTAANHPGVLQDRAPSAFDDPPPDRGRLHP